MIGPFQSEADTRPLTKPIYASDSGIKNGNLRLLRETIAAAKVDTGGLDDRTLDWLASWEPFTCAVIAGLIDRAYESGRVHG